MKIQRISQIGAAGMGVLFMLAIGIGAYDVNLIRIGGSLHNEEQAAADLLADSMPPTLSTADPYLIASKVMLGTISVGEAERTFQNDRRNYEERKAAVEKNEFLPEDVQDGFVREVLPSSDRFWDELQNNFIPVAKSGNADAARASFNRLTRLENENEVVIGRVVSKLLKADEEIEAKASKGVVNISIQLGLIMFLLAGAVGAAVWFLMRKVLQPTNAMIGYKPQVKIAAEGMPGRRLMPITQQLASQLDELGKSLERLGETLCADPAIISSHIGALQEIDRIAQMQFAIATIITADDPYEACLNSPLERVRKLALIEALAA